MPTAVQYDSIPALETPTEIFSLKDRVGIIVGGGGQMGRHFAKVLGLAGATVVLADLPAAGCRQTALEIAEQTGARVFGIDCDAADDIQVKFLFEQVMEKHRHLDFLIHGVMSKPEGYYRPTDQYPEKTWEMALQGNLTSAFLCCRQAEKYLKNRHYGSVVLISSIYGVVGPDQRIYQGCLAADNIYGSSDPLNCPAVYSATKAGLIGLGKHFAALWGPQHIRINILTPGGVYDGQAEPFHRKYSDRTPLGRMAVWSDFNGAILFLVSDASRYMTGSNLVVDGGWTSW